MNEKEIVKQVHSQLGILTVAEKYFDIVKQGEYYKASCIHGSDSTPSLVFYPKDNGCHCFGCNKNCSNIVEFIMWVEDCEFKEACQILIDKFGIELNIQTNPQLENINKIVNKCHKVLLANKEKMNYLINERGYTEESIKRYQLGLSEGSILYPITDEYGTFVGKALRQFNKEPKYINDKSNEFFKKRNILFGFSYIKKWIKKYKIIILVEGYNDALILQQYNAPAVSLMGTALTQNQVDLLKKYDVKMAILFLDGDKAGIKATNMASKLLHSNHISTYVVNLENKDPDDMAKEWKENTLIRIMEMKKLWWKYLIDNIKEKYMEKIYQLHMGFKDEIQQLMNSLDSPEIIAEILNIEKDFYLNF